MTDAERQAALNNISPEDLAKIQAVTNKSIKIDEEDLLEAEFALKFGWEAYRDLQDEKISGNKMLKLLVASRKLENLQQYRHAQAVLIGTAAANSKTPAKSFSTFTAKLLRSTEADK